MQDFIMRSIMKEINVVVAHEIHTAVENAKIEIESRLKEQTAHIALSILKEYDIQQAGDILTIRVRNMGGE